MLIILSGLPGTGKTTLARLLVPKLSALHLRVDTIEHALRLSRKLRADVGPAGYLVAYEVAEENLRLGATVVADSVNPIKLTRDAWLAVAKRASVHAVEIETICSDREEHRRRVESRTADLEGFRLPSWEDVLNRSYDPWERQHIVIDTKRPINVIASELLERLR